MTVSLLPVIYLELLYDTVVLSKTVKKVFKTVYEYSRPTVFTGDDKLTVVQICGSGAIFGSFAFYFV